MFWKVGLNILVPNAALKTGAAALASVSEAEACTIFVRNGSVVRNRRGLSLLRDCREQIVQDVRAVNIVSLRNVFQRT